MGEREGFVGVALSCIDKDLSSYQQNPYSPYIELLLMEVDHL
jgi:hypothetical protein